MLSRNTSGKKRHRDRVECKRDWIFWVPPPYFFHSQFLNESGFNLLWEMFHSFLHISRRTLFSFIKLSWEIRYLIMIFFNVFSRFFHFTHRLFVSQFRFFAADFSYKNLCEWRRFNCLWRLENVWRSLRNFNFFSFIHQRDGA